MKSNQSVGITGIDAEGIAHEPPLPKQYGTELLVLKEGKGVYLWDVQGNKYLDFGSGIAVNAMGYGVEEIARIAAEQIRKIVHTSNLYTTEPTLSLAAKLVASGPFQAVHFGNSGTEANETALKYARLYAKRKRGKGHHTFLTFTHAFHGRTMGALSVTPTEAYREPFEPLVPGVEVCPYNDVEALKRIVDDRFAGIIVEVVQGEGGLEVMRPEFAKALNEIRDTYDLILIADEVQTGLGRTGYLYASEAVGLKPDIITLAKPLAGGLPLSATLIPEKINALLRVGDHGSTFGGGPVTTAVASYLWDTVSNPSFLKEVQEKGKFLGELLEALREEYSSGAVRLTRVRGMGLLRGLEVEVEEGDLGDWMKQILQVARKEGILVLRSGKNVIRIAPPLVISRKEIEEGIETLRRALKSLAS
ncbi:MAG: aspartate aminotransferase family protein [Spirochaetes bacterium]|nr:aspartate aminotransferase family protein [Spirochaetota bacterium]